MNRLFAFLFAVTLSCFFSTVVMGQDPFGIFDKIKQKVQPSEEKGEDKQGKGVNQSMNTGQTTESKQGAETKQTVEVGPTTEGDKDIIGPGPQEDTANFIKVFDIPLNATVQTVVNVMEKKRIGLPDDPLTSYGIMFSMNWLSDKKGSFRDTISSLYDKWNPSEKNNALDVFNKKIKWFSFSYKTESYILHPKSLYVCLDSVSLYPVFHKDYDLYNSYFRLVGAEVSEDMRINRIESIDIYFVSIAQDIPRSFGIFLQFYRDAIEQKMIDVLTQKYGAPKVYCNLADMTKAEAEYCRNHFKNIEEKSKDSVMYGNLAGILSGNDPFDPQITGLYFDWFTFPMGNAALFEWKQGDLRVILKASFDAEYSSKSEDVKEIPQGLFYFYIPSTDKINEMFEKIKKDSQEEKQKAKGEATSKF